MRLLAAIITFFAVTPLFANPPAEKEDVPVSPIVTKINEDGFSADAIRRERCDVFTDKVRIIRQIGRRTTLEEKKVQIRGDYKSLLTLALAEKEETKDGLPGDAEVTKITVLSPTGDPSQPTNIFVTGTGGAATIFRSGPASSALRALVDQYCQTTSGE